MGPTWRAGPTRQGLRAVSDTAQAMDAIREQARAEGDTARAQQWRLEEYLAAVLGTEAAARAEVRGLLDGQSDVLRTVLDRS